MNGPEYFASERRLARSGIRRFRDNASKQADYAHALHTLGSAEQLSLEEAVLIAVAYAETVAEEETDAVH